MQRQERLERAWEGRVQEVRRLERQTGAAWTPPRPKETGGDAERSDATAAAGEEDWEAKDRVKTLRISRRSLKAAAARAWARQRIAEREQGIRRRQARGQRRVQRRRAERQVQRLQAAVVMVTGSEIVMQVVQGMVCWWRVQVRVWTAKVKENREGMVVALRVVAWAQRRWFRGEVRMRIAAWRTSAMRAMVQEQRDSERGLMVQGNPHRWVCEGCWRLQLQHTAGWEWRRCATCMARTEQLAKDTVQLEWLERQKARQEKEVYELERRVKDMEDYRDEVQQEIGRIQQGEVAVAHRAAMAAMDEREREAADRVKKVRKELRSLEKEWAKAHKSWANEEQRHELRKELNMEGTGEAVGAVMAAAVTGMGCFGSRDMGQGITMWTYKNAKPSEFEMAADGGVQAARQARWLRECRGLVVGADGVVARPLHKCFSLGQVADQRMGRVGYMSIQEATVKLDGIMVFGVVLDGVVEFWTRGGRTGEAVRVTRWVYAQQMEVGAALPEGEVGEVGAALPEGDGGEVEAAQPEGAEGEVGAALPHGDRAAVGAALPDCVGLVLAADAVGQTVIFEWVGRQARIKTKELTTRLVVVQVRDKTTGAYAQFEHREALAKQFRVECVARVPELEGQTLRSAWHQIAKKDRTRSEGVVLQLVDEEGEVPLMLKVKTQWWLKAPHHRYQRWRSEEQRVQEEARRYQKREHFQVQELRAVVKGWPGDTSPGLLCEWEQVHKVECFQARGTGKRGAIIVSFDVAADKEVMRAEMEAAGVAWTLENAYSCRSSSNSWHRVRTWYKGTVDAEADGDDEEKLARAVAEAKVMMAATYYGQTTRTRGWMQWRLRYQIALMKRTVTQEMMKMATEKM